MAAKQRFAWLISPKSFIQLIGAEYDLLRKSGSGALVKFYSAAVCILFILLISACSIFYAMELLFHMPHVEFVLALFVSILFVFIYVFLLNTFSKNIFKEEETKVSKEWYRRVNLSDIIRTGFVVFMAFLISKPIEVFIFKNELQTKVEEHRRTVYNDYSQKLVKLNGKEVRQLEAALLFYQQQFANHNSTLIQAEIDKLSARITTINSKEAAVLKNASLRIERSDFLLFRIREVSKKIAGWAICFGLVLLFLLPGYLIYSISATDAYYKLKKDYEVSMVLEEHKVFERLYSTIFLRMYHLDLVYYSTFLDPPFNNKPKPGPPFQTESDFFKKYSGD